MPETPIEQRLRAALQSPVATDSSVRERIMLRVHEAAQSARQPARAAAPRLRPRYSAAGLALAAGFSAIVTLGSLGDLAPAMRSTSRVAVASGSARDTIAGVFLDTMRLVQQWSAGSGQLALERRYAIVVDMTRHVPDPASAHLRGDDARVFTLLHPARVAD